MENCAVLLCGLFLFVFIIVFENLFGFITLTLPPNICDSHSLISHCWWKARTKDREPAEAGQSVDKARSADSIKLFNTEGHSYDANEDSACVHVACECVCVLAVDTY